MTNSNDFYRQITALETGSRNLYSEYGSRVVPVLELYKSLKTYEDRRAFQDALERMLSDPSEGVRKFAVDICLGFFVFRNAL